MARVALLSIADATLRAAVAARLEADGITVTDAAGDALPPVLNIVVIGIHPPAARPFVGTDPADWFAGVHTAITPPFALIRRAAPALAESGSGRIVLVARGWAAASDARSTASAAVNGAAIALVKTLARDLGPAGITVNEVAVPTEPSREAVAAVAAAVGYLVSPLGGATTGQVLAVGLGGEMRP